MSVKREKRIMRHRRVRSRVSGTKERPRLSVFRSSRHIFLQLIDDAAQKTVLSASDKNVKIKKGTNKKELAAALGGHLAKMAKEKGIERVVFDRGGYRYHGLVREVAEGARKGGLQF